MINTKNLRKRNSSRKSEVWNYFKFVDVGDVTKSLVECEICLSRIKYSGNTTNLRTHFLRWHSNGKTHDDNNSDHNSSGKSIHCEDEEEVEQYRAQYEEDNNKTLSVKKPKITPEDNDDSMLKQKRSFVWQYYEDIHGIDRNKSAKCKFCVQRIKCWGNTTNLMSHLKIKHSILPFAETSEPETLAKEVCPTANVIPMENISPEALIVPKEEIPGEGNVECRLSEGGTNSSINSDHEHNGRTSNFTEDGSNPVTSVNIAIWRYFDYVPNQPHVAKCKFCQEELIFKGNISRLQNHLKICQRKVTELQMSDREHQSKESENEETVVPEKELPLKEKHLKGIKKYSAVRRYGRSLVWDFFETVDDQNGSNVAKCIICLKDIRYCGNTTNLRYHLNRWHGIYLGGMKPIPIKTKARTKTRQYFTLINKKNKQIRSRIWSNFDVFRGDNNKILGRCKTCSTFIKSGQSTKSLARHIKICRKKESRFDDDFDSSQRSNSTNSDIVKAESVSNAEINIDGGDSDCSDNTGRINGVLTLSHSELGDRSVVCLETNISSTGEQKLNKTHSNTKIIKEQTDHSKNCSYQRRKSSNSGNNSVCDMKDDCEVFGSLVETQMRDLRNEVSRKLLKRRILQAILEITDSDGKLEGNLS